MFKPLCVACTLLAGAQTLCADVTTIGASKDNTLFEDATGSLSNGAGPHLYVGKTGNFASFRLRRGLIAFDVAGSVPAGSTIQSVTLTLHLSQAAPGSGNQTVSLHRVLADWGEGASNAETPGGMGATALPGDATWLHTFFDTSLWSTAGGDFTLTVSASATVGVMTAFYTWGSTPQMEADVQSALDNPASNFGWLIRGNEVDGGTAKRFDTRENATPSFRPMLEIEFDPPPCPEDVNGDGDVNVLDLIDLLLCFGLPAVPGCESEDVNTDGTVNVLDLIDLLLVFGTSCP
ncbi:MAG: DNRLRE domain-containing protein [Planctomycetota bacterium]|jgi:hypothetical protein